VLTGRTRWRAARSKAWTAAGAPSPLNTTWFSGAFSGTRASWGLGTGSRRYSVVKVLGCYWGRQVTPGMSADRSRWATASSPGSAPIALLASRGSLFTTWRPVHRGAGGKDLWWLRAPNELRLGTGASVERHWLGEAPGRAAGRGQCRQAAGARVQHRTTPVHVPLSPSTNFSHFFFLNACISLSPRTLFRVV
jgi:hypothetical protein